MNYSKALLVKVGWLVASLLTDQLPASVEFCYHQNQERGWYYNAVRDVCKLLVYFMVSMLFPCSKHNPRPPLCTRNTTSLLFSLSLNANNSMTHFLENILYRNRKWLFNSHALTAQFWRALVSDGTLSPEELERYTWWYYM